MYSSEPSQAKDSRLVLLSADSKRSFLDIYLTSYIIEMTLLMARQSKYFRLWLAAVTRSKTQACENAHEKLLRHRLMSLLMSPAGVQPARPSFVAGHLQVCYARYGAERLCARLLRSSGDELRGNYSGITGEDVRDLTVAAVEHRFAPANQLLRLIE